LRPTPPLLLLLVLLLLHNRTSTDDVEFGMRVCIGGQPDWAVYPGKGDPNVGIPAGLALTASFGRVFDPAAAPSKIWKDVFVFAG
jgi:hypothetical protein